MNKEELYQQIDNFNTTLTDPSNRRSQTYQEARLYINSDEAIDKASFIKYLIDNEYMQNSYNTILDLTFGSGNLTSHILFDNDITYETLYLNDKNIEKTNQNIKDYIDNCSILGYDILEDSISSDINADLVILNPQLGGNYTEGDLYQQRQEKEKNQDILNKLASNIETYLENGATVLFYGENKDFKSLFEECKYIRYKSESKQLYIVKNDLEDIKCFQKTDNSFEEVDCNGSDVIEDDEALDFDDLILEIDNIEDENTQKEVSFKENREIKKIKFSAEAKGNLEFPYKNILFKGVPGTGKSRAINEIIIKHLGLAKNDKNTLRINIHSASSNSDLMQGIGISTNDKGNIKYSEKQGLILDIIKRATLHPKQPFVLILEEIQENSLNELIGDLIYLIEDDKRAKLTADNQKYDSYEELVDKLVDKDETLDYVEIPYLVNDSTKYKKMIMPNNLFIFCTSNYRDDKKVIEDNLLRRFEVVEIYPKNQEQMGKNDKDEYFFKRKEISDFLESLNQSILQIMKDNHEIHPDRFIIGHAIWQNVDDDISFYKSFLKLVVEFKDIREVEFDTFKTIIDKVAMPYLLKPYNSYYEMIRDLQHKIGYEFIN